MKKIPILLLASTLFLTLSAPIHAAILDLEMLILATKQLAELRSQYAVLQETAQTSKNQLDALNQMKAANTGHFGYGSLDNNLTTLQNWQSPASTWQDALQNLSGGNPSRYQSLLDAYEKNHPVLNESNYAQHVSSRELGRFKEDKAVNRAVQTQTTDSYNEINKHMTTLFELSKKIDTATTTKAAVDLNARLLTEIGFIQLMGLRLQTLMNQQVSQESLSALQDRAEMAAFNH